MSKHFEAAEAAIAELAAIREEENHDEGQGWTVGGSSVVSSD